MLAHEMGHVIARHAAIREEQARQVAIIGHVVSDVLSDPQVGALALAKSKLTLAAFSRAQEFEADGIGVGISARAGFDPYGASRFLSDMQRNADLKASDGAGPRGIDFLSSHPATPERVKNALANARQFSGPGRGERDHTDYLAVLDGLVYGEDPSEGFARGRHFLHPKLGFSFVAPPGFTLDNTAQAVLGLKDRRRRSFAAGCGERAGGAVAARLSQVRLDGKCRSGQRRGVHRQRFPGGDRDRERHRWAFRLFAVRFGSDVYRFIFAAKNRTEQIDRAFRESVMTFRRMTLKESEQVKPLHLKIVTVARRRHRRETRAPHGARPTIRSSASACSMGWAHTTAETGRKGEAGGGVSCAVARAHGELHQRHARACRGHPRLTVSPRSKTWMAGTRPAMTRIDAALRPGTAETQLSPPS